MRLMKKRTLGGRSKRLGGNSKNVGGNSKSLGGYSKVLLFVDGWLCLSPRSLEDSSQHQACIYYDASPKNFWVGTTALNGSQRHFSNGRSDLPNRLAQPMLKLHRNGGCAVACGNTQILASTFLQA